MALIVIMAPIVSGSQITQGAAAGKTIPFETVTQSGRDKQAAAASSTGVWHNVNE